MADFDPNEFLQTPEPKAPAVPPGVGTRAAEPTLPAPKTDDKTPSKPSAAPSSSKQSGASWWKGAQDYVTHFGTSALRGFLSSATAAGEDVTAGLPPGITDPALGDVALQEARRTAAEKVKGWTPAKDPRYKLTEGAGEFLGESVMPSALASLIPGGRGTEAAVKAGGKYLLKDATKGVPSVLKGKGGKFTSNPAFQAAKTANVAAEEKLAKGAKIAGGVVREGERGTVAGLLQPEEDRTKAGAIGGGTAVATEIGRKFLPSGGRVMNLAAATAATVALEKVLGHGLTLSSVEHLGIHDYMIWHAVYLSHLGEGVGMVGKVLGQPAVVGGTAAYATGTKRQEE